MSFPRTNSISRTWSALTIHGLAVWLLISSIGCGYLGPPNIRPEEPNVVSLDPENWYIFYSAGMPPHPATDPEGAWSFDFPSSETGGHVNYVETPFSATTALHGVTVTFRVESVAPQYVVLDPADHLPATCRLLIERQNDDLSDPNGRWWAAASMYNLGSQDGQMLTITVPLTSDQWSNVEGKQNAQAFSQALEHIGWVGVTFGGQYFAGHGVAISSGSAKYILIDFTIN
jgi:hypothetical protein